MRKRSLAYQDETDFFDLWWQYRLSLLEVDVRTAKFWTVKIAAFVAEKTPNRVRSWVSEGKVQGRRIGGTVLIVPSSLEHFLRQTGEN